VADADADVRVPPGGKFIPALMHCLMRFRIRRSQSGHEHPKNGTTNSHSRNMDVMLAITELILTYSFRVA
jgi:hypothetical protein